MKKFTGVLLFLLAGLLFAETIDVTKSEGTDQSIIDSLTPAPASPEADANTTIEAVFNEALNPMSTMHSVTLKRLTGKKKRWGMFGFGISRSKNKTVKGSVIYDRNENILRFIPNQPLEVGFYEVVFRHLMKMSPGMGMRVKPIVYRFYVPEVINGFKLPPEPDEDKNNKTLLGVDFNRNGIRDDVERWAIVHYKDKHPIYTDIALQAGRDFKLVLERPKDAKEIREKVNSAQTCTSYYRYYAKLFNEKLLVNERIDDKVFNHYFNTDDRKKIYWEYDTRLSGDSYPLPDIDKEKSYCDFDTHKYEE
ncbi:Ig-like domain-containing protein [Sulfurovum sp.]|uniref:Ig-like domain-containing protein n=1 Tax=Sulfurovum sp. TaxID=1969726 RepID=UPI0025F53B9E|nr:Ig-like domain-containing protein [Sulfurovum sp.]